jgi:threonine-phosphate decarboxylase
MLKYEHGGNADENITLDFSININPLGAPESVKRAIIENVSEYERYPDPFCRKLRAALAELRGVGEKNILCGNGASELIFAICAALKPKIAFVQAPTFSEYERAVNLFGGTTQEFASLENICENAARADIVFVCNPNNPSGLLADSALLKKIAALCRVLVIDECFIDFTKGETMLGRLAEFPNMIIIRAFTKIYAMAGLRLGELYCANGRILNRVGDFRPTWSVSSVAQIAGVAALAESGWIEKTRQTVEAERNFLTEALRRPGIDVPRSDANFLLIKSNLDLFSRLKARGILTRNCANFSGLDDSYIRVGVKTRDKNLTLLNAIEEIYAKNFK